MKSVYQLREHFFSCFLFCLLLVLPTIANAGSSNLSRIVVAYQPGDANSQGIVKQAGWFNEVDGIKVVYKDFRSGADVYRAMASGAIDFGLIGNAPFTIAVTHGAKYKALWWYDIGTTAEGLVVRKSSHLNEVSQLKGHTVATPFGSTADYMLHGALHVAGLRPSNVRLINANPQALLAGWERGDINAAYIWTPVLNELKAKGGKIIVYDKDLLKHGYLAGDLGVVSTSFLKDHPKVVRAWMKANVRAMNEIRNSPKEAYKIASKAYGVPANEIKVDFSGDLFPTGKEQLGPKYLGGLGEGLLHVAKLLAAEKLISAAKPASTYKAAVDLEPLRDALAH